MLQHIIESKERGCRYPDLRQLYTKMRAVFFSSQVAGSSGQVIHIAFANTIESLEEMSAVIKAYVMPPETMPLKHF